MKGEILCPRCKEHGRKPKVLAKYEDVAGKGILCLYCKQCRMEIRIKVEDIGLDR